MQRRTLKRFLAYSLLVASLALAAASAKPQERQAQPLNGAVPIVKGECPRPIALTLTAGTPYVDKADFTPDQLKGNIAGLGNLVSNKSFLHTFQWKQDERCCEITRAVLTVKMKSNQPGYSLSDNQAGNDGIAIMHAQAAVQPYSQAVYGGFPGPVSGAPAVTYPFPVGQPSVKTWTLTGQALQNLKTNRRLSIYVQDDTTIESATLQIWGCCLSTQQKEAESLTNSSRN